MLRHTLAAVSLLLLLTPALAHAGTSLEGSWALRERASDGGCTKHVKVEVKKSDAKTGEITELDLIAADDGTVLETFTNEHTIINDEFGHDRRDGKIQDRYAEQFDRPYISIIRVPGKRGTKMSLTRDHQYLEITWYDGNLFEYDQQIGVNALASPVSCEYGPEQK
ncbi:MAG: hypothetical protein ACXWP1_00840 [Bdellovibrionota bacterium]